MSEQDPHVVKQLAKDPTFEIGDVVRLVSGGPSMSIRQLTGDEITCEWFDKATAKSHTFLKKQLQHTNPEQLPVLTFGRWNDKETQPPWDYLSKKQD